MNGIRINRVSQIVRLKHKMKMALNRRVCSVTSCALSPTSDQRSVFSTTYDSDEECCRCPASPPPDVPEGYLAVYVGRERKRFVVPTCYLIRPVFRALLQKAEEEFGFDHKGGLTIPCEINVFEHVLQLLGRNDGDMLILDELVNCIYCDKSEDNSCSRGFPALRLGNG